MALLGRKQYLCEPPLVKKCTLLRQEFVELLLIVVYRICTLSAARGFRYGLKKA